MAIAETKKAGSFTLPGLGKLVLVKRNARRTHPATGATINIPAKTVVKCGSPRRPRTPIVPPKQ